MAQLNMVQAINGALASEMRRDDRVVVLGEDAGVREVVEHVYVDVDEKLWPVAESSVKAQLDYLRA